MDQSDSSPGRAPRAIAREVIAPLVMVLMTCAWASGATGSDPDPFLEKIRPILEE